MRLDAYLSRAGLASRRGARELVRHGRVEVDGEICRDPGQQIASESVTLDGERVGVPDLQAHFILHKPVGYACSSDEREAPLVRDLLPEDLRRLPLKIAGRLDRATSGLLLLTTDGGLAHRVTHPARKLPKRYLIGYRGTLVRDAVARCDAGFPLGADEKPTVPAKLALNSDGRATLELREGRTHQVRRMIRALGATVTELHRDRIGRLVLPEGLEPGAFRRLEADERELLLSDSDSNL